MGNSRLKPGEDNISSRKVTEERGRGWRLQWNIRLYNGQLLKKVTRGKKSMTKGEIRARARATAAQLLRSSGTPGTWKSTSSISDYIKSESIASVESSERLRPNTKDRYIHLLELLADELVGFSIADGCRLKNLEIAFNNIARNHGTSSAKQVRKVANKWVMQRLVLDEVIEHNPLNEVTLEITVEYKATKKGEGNVALTEDEYQRALDFMLGCDYFDPVRTKPKRGRYTPKDLAAKRKNVIELCLLQATTGLRINEARMLLWSDVDIDGDDVFITVRPEVSKTRRGRTVQVLDARVAKRLIERSETAQKGAKHVFGAPLIPKHVWDKTNCDKAVNGYLQDEVASECEINKLKDHGSHIWRATLSTIAMHKGIPDEIRAAAFGQSPEVNRNYYTDTTDITSFTKSMVQG